MDKTQRVITMLKNFYRQPTDDQAPAVAMEIIMLASQPDATDTNRGVINRDGAQERMSGSFGFVPPPSDDAA